MCTAMEIFKKKIENIGYEKGESVGIEKERKKSITNMHNNGLSIDEIVKFINLSKKRSMSIFRYLEHS